jgi:hypothetical protein
MVKIPQFAAAKASATTAPTTTIGLLERTQQVHENKQSPQNSKPKDSPQKPQITQKAPKITQEIEAEPEGVISTLQSAEEVGSRSIQLSGRITF